jgi:ABC-2 type transport system permease protein
VTAPATGAAGAAGAVGAAGASGAVYDRGYRPYDGPRGGHGASVAALYRASLRRALGLRRPWRQKVLPWSLLVIVTIPAAVNVGVAYLTRDTQLEQVSIIGYRQYVGVSSALLLFVAYVAPDLICPDRRMRVLPLIFARPLTGRDYALAKLAALGSLLFAFSFLPQVVLFVGQMLVSRDGALDYLADNAAVLWQVPVAVALLAGYYAAVGLAVASLTARRIVAGASFLGLLLISSAVAGILRAGSGVSAATDVVNLLALPIYVRDLVFLGHIDPRIPLSSVDGGGVLAVIAYVAVLGVAVSTLLWRYREADA